MLSSDNRLHFGKTNQAQGRSRSVDPFHYITLFSIFPCGLLVLFKTNSRTRSTTDGGREAAAGGYRLKLVLAADSPFDSSSSILRGQPQLPGECDKEFSKEENTTLSFAGSVSCPPGTRRPNLLKRAQRQHWRFCCQTSSGDAFDSTRLPPTVKNRVRPLSVELREDLNSTPSHPFSFLAIFPWWLFKVTSARQVRMILTHVHTC